MPRDPGPHTLQTSSETLLNVWPVREFPALLGACSTDIRDHDTDIAQRLFRRLRDNYLLLFGWGADACEAAGRRICHTVPEEENHGQHKHQETKAHPGIEVTLGGWPRPAGTPNHLKRTAMGIFILRLIVEMCQPAKMSVKHSSRSAPPPLMLTLETAPLSVKWRLALS